MTTVRLLADDLTGALDTAAEFAQAARPMHAFWHGALPEHFPTNAAIDAGTREQDTETARAAVGALTSALRAGEIAYKKVDSLMRGPTLVEIASCFAVGFWRCGVFAPAFPFQGRVTRGGRQWVRDAGGWSPAGPPLVGALRAQGVPAQQARPGAELQMLRQGAARRLQPIRFGRGGHARVGLGRVLLLQLLQREFKLGDLGVQPFGGAAEMHPPQLGELRLQPGNQLLPVAQFRLLTGNRRRLRGDQRTYFFRQSGDVECHTIRIAACIASAPMIPA